MELNLYRHWTLKMHSEKIHQQVGHCISLVLCISAYAIYSKLWPSYGYCNSTKIKAQIFRESRWKTSKELWRFLGMAGYYRKLIKNFAELASPLTHLYSKATKFTEEARNGMQSIKKSLKPVLVHLIEEVCCQNCWKIQVVCGNAEI